MQVHRRVTLLASPLYDRACQQIRRFSAFPTRTKRSFGHASWTLCLLGIVVEDAAERSVWRLRFLFCADDIQPLKGPKSFYTAVVDGIRRSKKRVVLCALYLGSGDLERACLRAIENQLDAEEDLEVTFLFDGARGTRRNDIGECTASMLVPLVEKYGSRVQTAFFVMPQLRQFRSELGFRKDGGLGLLLPSPVDETVAVMHVKTMVFDDDVLLTGANLSHDYFTSRQDRYVRFCNNGVFADYCAKFIDVIASYGERICVDKKQWQLKPNYNSSTTTDSLMEELVSDVLQLQDSHHGSSSKAEANAWVVPSMTLPGYMGQNEEVLFATLNCLDPRHDARSKQDRPSASLRTRLTMACAYMNPPDVLVDRLRGLGKQGVLVDLITAHHRSHGFSGASGLKAVIPALYERLVENVSKTLRDHVKLLRWRSEGWIFHGKGLWISTLPHFRMSNIESETSNHSNGAGYNAVPVSIVTSSNFGFRSFYRDMEVQVLVVTEERDLQSRLAQEIEQLVRQSERHEQYLGTPSTPMHGVAAYVLRSIL